MAAEKLGLGRCPVCGGVHARVSLSKNGLAVMTCTAPECGVQIFARGEGADEKLRDLIVTQAAAPAPADDKPIKTLTVHQQPAAKPARAPIANPFDFLLNPGRAHA